MRTPRNIERWKQAYDLRQAGKTYTEIGRVLGVSSARARDIVRSFERYEYNLQNPGAVAARIVAALDRAGLDLADAPLPLDVVRHIEGIGIASLRALLDAGYLDKEPTPKR